MTPSRSVPWFSNGVSTFRLLLPSYKRCAERGRRLPGNVTENSTQLSPPTTRPAIHLPLLHKKWYFSQELASQWFHKKTMAKSSYWCPVAAGIFSLNNGYLHSVRKEYQVNSLQWTKPAFFQLSSSLNLFTLPTSSPFPHSSYPFSSPSFLLPVYSLLYFFLFRFPPSILSFPLSGLAILSQLLLSFFIFSFYFFLFCSLKRWFQQRSTHIFNPLVSKVKWDKWWQNILNGGLSKGFVITNYWRKLPKHRLQVVRNN